MGGHEMRNVSVVLAVHNEERSLAKCLESVVDFADEIVIADGESTDTTRNIARSFKARIIKTTNKQNFHINKQKAIDAANHPLILQLDADEQVDGELSEWISRLKNIPDAEFQSLPAAWWIKRKNNFLGGYLRKGGQYPDPVIRLFKKGKARLPMKNVHEQMTVSGDIGWAKGHLLHDSNPTLAIYMKKFRTYTSFEAQRLHDEGIHPSFFLAIQYGVLKPLVTFFSLTIRHKGVLDGWRGIAFAALSAAHHPVTYTKLAHLYET